ncbi:MAG: tRNA adenosine(34) deaminase TadA [Firmicutes bacterium]|nr:tRNA adenosine(34) deaminase TadA [Bacillota bacterium]
MTPEEKDIFYMREALRLAQCAADAGDTPIGAVMVYEDRIIGRGYNMRNALHSPLMHAEIEAIRQAAAEIGDWRLEETTMYITLEPCPMCAGAIVQARIPRVVVGAMNPKAGCAGSIINLLQMDGFNHRAELVTGVLQEESAALLREFFSGLRLRDRQRKEERKP